MPVQNPSARLIKRLQRTCTLSAADVRAIEALPFHLREYGSDTDIVREGDRPSQSCLVVEGCLYRFNVVANGKRQVLSFNYPSDIPDLQSFHLGKMDHNLGTLTKSVVAFMPHDSLAELTDHHPRIAACLWRESHADAAITRQWIVNLGRRSALSRVAHLLCEQALRLKQIGLGDETGFPWFFTQAVLADATGLSVVHVNRMLQELRTKRLVGAYDSKRLTILDWDGLVAVAEFDPPTCTWVLNPVVAGLGTGPTRLEGTSGETDR